MTNTELLRDVEHWRKEARESMKIQAVLEEKILEVKKIIGDIMENPQMDCYANNMLIPCKAPCGREFEQILSSILAIQNTLRLDRMHLKGTAEGQTSVADKENKKAEP